MKENKVMNQSGWRRFIKLCLSTNDEKMLSSLLDCFLTSEEMESLATRCLIIIELIKKEKSQREIAKELGVSIAKITRGSNELKRISPKLMHFLNNNINS